MKTSAKVTSRSENSLHRWLLFPGYQVLSEFEILSYFARYLDSKQASAEWSEKLGAELCYLP